jgi:hypothetical protein
MRNCLSEHVLFSGPCKFSAKEVFSQDDLFRHRAALFLTPTKNIPSIWVGKGFLDIRLSILTPDFIEFQEIRSYAIPRFWVDLIQQATRLIRWTPLEKAHVRIIRYDQVKLRDDHFRIGTKALVDSLKFKTSGRRDGRSLYYFGAIMDDDGDSATFEYRQEIVDCKSFCGIQIQVTDT